MVQNKCKTAGKQSQLCVIKELKHAKPQVRYHPYMWLEHACPLCLTCRSTHISSPARSQPSQVSLTCSLTLCHRRPSSCCSRSLWVWDVLDLCRFHFSGLFLKRVTALLVTVEAKQWITCRGEFVSLSRQLCMSVAPKQQQRGKYCGF